ncbi:DUF885 domain-containing protein [Jiangella sp. DSM 45060]|uniref:DUF885 domain-containing protein n=1 Tax=Jiangella sp. DSM 45060 TaxID=1798224 RepID=UPI00087DDF48|nr:DUF885 domain-containing protein [Jiangella sp. DSM 45060]SDT28903.1 Uncharacterized conserved protein, DUF885 familyt [Jiangella sp. DSM 45060]
MTDHETVTAVADAYLGELAEVEPRAAEALGRDHVTAIPDLSPESYDQRLAIARRAAGRLDAATTGTPADEVLRSALAERLASDIALHEAGFTTALLAPLATPVHLVRQVFDNLPTRTADDWTTVAADLARVPVALRQYAATLDGSAGRGHVVAGRQVLAVAAQCESWVADGFYPGLVASAQVPPSLRQELEAAALAAAEATTWFAGFLRDDLLPRAGERDAVGEELYQVTSAAFLGARIDLRETYAHGWAELAALTEELGRVAAEVSPDGVAAAVARLDADPSGRIDGVEALERWLQQRADETMAAVDGVWFDVPARTRTVECRVTPAAAGVMYYTPPDPGLTRPGRVWWTLPDGVRSAQTWREVNTLHHEGVPGHHLQHAITMTLPGLHPWQRSLCHVHGYAEGWAHYSETLADEFGLVRTPGERMGMIYGQLWRAARIVIDLGLHLQLPIPPANGLVHETRWTPDLGRDVLVRLAGVDPQTAGFEVDRYLGWPGQALAFRVGARLWREARADAERRDGAAFDLKRFHMDALRLGPLGLGPLREILAERGAHGRS